MLLATLGRIARHCVLLLFAIAIFSVACNRRPSEARDKESSQSSQQAKSSEKSDPRIETDHTRLPDASSFRDLLDKDLSAKYEGKRIGFDAYNIGDLELTTGKIIACDGFIPGSLPFQTVVPPGRYPVLIAIARLGDDERIAFARVQFAERSVARWSMALYQGQDPSALKPDQVSCYPVDSGIGSFIEEAALPELEKVMDNDGFHRILDEMKKVHRHTRDWARINTRSGGAALFSSGFGDGRYVSYFGYDTEGKPVALITDFEVIEWKP